MSESNKPSGVSSQPQLGKKSYDIRLKRQLSKFTSVQPSLFDRLHNESSRAGSRCDLISRQKIGHAAILMKAELCQGRGDLRISGNHRLAAESSESSLPLWPCILGSRSVFAQRIEDWPKARRNFASFSRQSSTENPDF